MCIAINLLVICYCCVIAANVSSKRLDLNNSSVNNKGVIVNALLLEGEEMGYRDNIS